MSDQNYWESFFDDHAPHYLENSFTKNTLAEVDFLIEELQLPPGSLILDVGCGTGRHAIELTKRGYRVTGVDISRGMLAEARRRAAEERVSVEWIKADATTFKPERQYDAVICLCEGAFGLLTPQTEPFRHSLSILRNISVALKMDSLLIMTVLNGYARIRNTSQADVNSGRFNPITMVETYSDEWNLPEGKQQVQIVERTFLPSELKGMLELLGMQVRDMWGGTVGAWDRKPIQLDELEIMVVAKKVEEIRTSFSVLK